MEADVEAVVAVADNYVPHNLLLQWHITERCNLRCSHCYQDNYRSHELDFAELLEILSQFKTLLATFRRRAGKEIRGHITVTGGEPFVRQDFLKLLQIFHEQRNLFSFAILTNGSLIDRQLAKQLRQLAPNFIQVSVEGTEKTHDYIRGQGDFARTVSAIKHLRHEHIYTLISFTAHRGNFQELPAVIELGQRLGINRVWTDRLVPFGHGEQLKSQVLTPAETQIFFHSMNELRLKTKRAWFKHTEIAMHRALQFLVADGHPYHCTAGDSLLTIQPNGDLYPCRRMPIRVGNVLETSLSELYEQSELLKTLRDPKQVSIGCAKCWYANVCRGGLKCLAYAITGNPFVKDPGCWL